MNDDLLATEIEKQVATLGPLELQDLLAKARDTVHGHTTTVEQRRMAQLQLTAAIRRMMILEGDDPDRQVGARGLQYASGPYVGVDGSLVEPSDDLTDADKERLTNNAKWMESEVAAKKAQRDANQKDYADRRAAQIVITQHTIDWAAARKQAAEEAAKVWARIPE